MPILFIILIVLAVVFFGLGFIVKWLFILAVIFLIVGVIGFILRSIRGRA
jgi:hypothetical protein